MARKSNEQFTKEVKELTNGEYVFQEEYKGSNLRIEALHVICGETFKVKPTEFLRNNKRCPGCLKQRKEQAKEQAKQERLERERAEHEASAEPGAVVSFYQSGYVLSRSYVYATNGITVYPGDNVVVMSSLKIGIGVVTELCTIHSKGDHLGIVERLNIKLEL